MWPVLAIAIVSVTLLAFGGQRAGAPRSFEKGAAYGFALGDINGDKFPDIALARTGDGGQGQDVLDQRPAAD